MSEGLVDSRRLTLQSVSSLFQVVVSTAALFFLYRILLSNVGIAHVGVWSLVMATGSLAQVAQLGLSGSVVRYVAKYGASGDTETVKRVIRTAAISVGIFYCIVLAVGFPLVRLFLTTALPTESITLALQILPHAVFSFWLMSLAGVYQAGLEGRQRYVPRNLILACDAISYLALCAFLTPRYGLVGLAWSRVIQNTLTCIAFRIALSRHLVGLGSVGILWDRSLFGEMRRYAVSFQLVSLLAMLFEPLVKGLLSHFGSVSAVGYFEMASRLTVQVRSLIVGAVQVVVPYLASLHETAPDRVHHAYSRVSEVVFFLAVSAFGTLIAAMPLIGAVWIGEETGHFLGYAVFIAIGWCLNTICVPAYFAGVGSGRLRWNLISHVVMVATNAMMGTMLGRIYGGDGVVAAWAISLALGGVVVGVAYHRENGISPADLIPPPGRALAAASLVGLLIAYGVRLVSPGLFMPVPFGMVMILLFLMTSLWAFWNNPTRRYLFGMLVVLCRRQETGAESI